MQQVAERSEAPEEEEDDGSADGDKAAAWRFGSLPNLQYQLMQQAMMTGTSNSPFANMLNMPQIMPPSSSAGDQAATEAAEASVSGAAEAADLSKLAAMVPPGAAFTPEMLARLPLSAYQLAPMASSEEGGGGGGDPEDEGMTQGQARKKQKKMNPSEMGVLLTQEGMELAALQGLPHGLTLASLPMQATHTTGVFELWFSMYYNDAPCFRSVQQFLH